MNLEGRIGGEYVPEQSTEPRTYALFSEQFLERPDMYELGKLTGPTVCTIWKVPAFDDW